MKKKTKKMKYVIMKPVPTFLALFGIKKNSSNN